MYPDKRAIFSFDFKTADMAGAISDNTDLFSVLIPAGVEVEVQGMYGHVRLASDTATDSIELVKEDDTVIAQVFLGSTGKITAKASGQTASGTNASFPYRVAPQSTSALSLLKLRSNGATDTSTDATIQFHISGLTAA